MMLSEDDIATLLHVRIFLTSREKIHPVGLEQWDEMVARLTKTNIADPNPVTVEILSEFLHADQPIMLGGRSQPLSVYKEFARLILSEFNLRRKPPISA
jgi:hypothetical protein